MRGIRKIWLYSLVFLFAACGTGYNREFLHSSHKSSVERRERDSIYLRDSVFVMRRADTVFYEKLRTVYRDRYTVDTFMVCDTVCREKVVTVEKIVKRYPPVWLLLLLPLLGYACRKGVLGWLFGILKKIIK